MKLIQLDDPFDHIDKAILLATTDDPTEEKFFKYVTWYGIEYNGKIIVVISYQELSETVVSVAGWAVEKYRKTFLFRSMYKTWLKFLILLRSKGYERIYASTLKTNTLGIRFNEHAGYKIDHEDDTTIYWFKEL